MSAVEISTEAVMQLFVLLGAEEPDNAAVSDLVIDIIEPGADCALQLVAGLMAGTIALLRTAGLVPDRDEGDFFGIVPRPGAAFGVKQDPAAAQVLIAFMNDDRDIAMEIAWTKLTLAPDVATSFLFDVISMTRQTILTAHAAKEARS